MSSLALSTSSHRPGLKESLSSMAQGVSGFVKELRERIATKVIATIEKTKTLTHNLSLKATEALKQRAIENIRRTNDTVDEAHNRLSYLQEVKVYVKNALEAQSGLIKMEYRKKQEEIQKTKSDMEKTREEMSKTGRWSLPGKKAKILKKYQTLSASLAQYHEQGQELVSRHARLRTFGHRISTIDSTIQREGNLIKNIQNKLNPTPPPDTISELRALTTSFAREHKPLFAISTIEIGNIGLELTNMYRFFEKKSALETHTF